MAKYTMTLHTLVKNQYDLGLAEYPIHDESYRENLNTKIINYYLMYEIAFETAYMFKVQLNTRMNMIMCKYALMYDALGKMDNPFSNVDVHEDFHGENENERNSDFTQNGKSTNTNKEVYNDTPMTQLDSNKDYATSITNDDGEGTTDNTGNSNDKGESQTDTNRHKYGYEGITQAELYKQYVEAIDVIDMLVIKDLADLFMLIY